MDYHRLRLIWISPHPSIASDRWVVKVDADPVKAKIYLEIEIFDDVPKLLVVILLAVWYFLQLDKHSHLVFVNEDAFLILSPYVLSVESHALSIVLIRCFLSLLIKVFARYAVSSELKLSLCALAQDVIQKLFMEDLRFINPLLFQHFIED